MRSMRVGAALCALAAAGPAMAGGAIHQATGRAFVSGETYYDAGLGNGWQRVDRFTNVSGSSVVNVTGVQILMYDPEDVPANPGFDDIFGHPTNPPTNVGEVVAAAAAANPTFHPSFGADWWPGIDTIEVDWQTAQILGPSFPLTLQPGQSFDLTVRAHNSVMGPVFNGVDDFGELVIGFRLLGEVVGGCTGDINNDGEVDVTDLIELVLDWNQTGSPADLNGDGTVDVQDLIELVLNWGPC
jgi:hypothetical protein